MLLAEAVKTLKASVGLDHLRVTKQIQIHFTVDFINDVKEVSFQDGGKVEFTTKPTAKKFP